MLKESQAPVHRPIRKAIRDLSHTPLRGDLSASQSGNVLEIVINSAEHVVTVADKRSPACPNVRSLSHKDNYFTFFALTAFSWTANRGNICIALF